MTNTFKLTSQVATNSMLQLLLNYLVWGKNVNTSYSQYFGSKADAKGDTITIRRAQEFTVRDGATFDAHPVTTGSATVTINKQKGVDITWQPFERELSVDELLNNSILKAKMAALAQQIESDIANEALEFAHWAGTPGQTVNSASDFLQAPQYLDEAAVPMADRVGILPPADFYATGASFTSQTFYGNDINDPALTRMKLPMIGSVQPYMAQTALSLTTGTRTANSLGFAVNGASQNVNYADVKDGYTQTLSLKNFVAGGTVKKGEVFTIANVFAVNPRTKVAESYLQQFVVMADATANSVGVISLTIANPIIAATGSTDTLQINTAFQTVSAAPANNAAVTFVASTASTNHKIPCVFHRDAIHLAFVKPERPLMGEYSYATDPTTGITIRNWGFSDGSADTHSYRCDVLYGVDNIDRRLGTKLSGTA